MLRNIEENCAVLFLAALLARKPDRETVATKAGVLTIGRSFELCPHGSLFDYGGQHFDRVLVPREHFDRFMVERFGGASGANQNASRAVDPQIYLWIFRQSYPPSVVSETQCLIPRHHPVHRLHVFVSNLEFRIWIELPKHKRARPTPSQLLDENVTNLFPVKRLSA